MFIGKWVDFILEEKEFGATPLCLNSNFLLLFTPFNLPFILKFKPKYVFFKLLSVFRFFFLTLKRKGEILDRGCALSSFPDKTLYLSIFRFVLFIYLFLHFYSLNKLKMLSWERFELTTTKLSVWRSTYWATSSTFLFYYKMTYLFSLYSSALKSIGG